MCVMACWIVVDLGPSTEHIGRNPLQLELKSRGASRRMDFKHTPPIRSERQNNADGCQLGCSERVILKGLAWKMIPLADVALLIWSAWETSCLGDKCFVPEEKSCLKQSTCDEDDAWKVNI